MLHSIHGKYPHKWHTEEKTNQATEIDKMKQKLKTPRYKIMQKQLRNTYSIQGVNWNHPQYSMMVKINI